MEYCIFLDWRGLTSTELAAWVQAVGSIAAIAAAGRFPIWHQRIEIRRRIDNYVALVAIALDYAKLDLKRIAVHQGSRLPHGYDTSHWTRLNAAFNFIPFHDLPHFSLLQPIEDARAESLLFTDLLTQATTRLDADPYIADMTECLSRLRLAYDLAANARNRLGGQSLMQRLRYLWSKRRQKALARRIHKHMQRSVEEIKERYGDSAHR